MYARDLVSDLIPVLRTSNTGIEAIQLMDEARVGHLPIVNNESFLGLISEDDIYDLDQPEQPIGNHRLSLPRPFVLEHQHVYEVIRVMWEEKLSVLPVLDQHQNYQGCILVQDLLGHFAGLSAANQPGGIIVLEVNQTDLVLSEIARIVESNDAKVLSLYVGSPVDSTRLDVTLKLNRMDIGPVLQTFSRFNYVVKATFTEGEYTDDLRER
ncbi:MAG TPA: CBS domain-containing protein, partial [Bacteroidales bacterium]|nr:CBS domain-containing protein [Bacteroidales bacterium]